MMGYENFFYVQDGGMKFSVIVRNYPPPWYPGLKMTAPSCEEKVYATIVEKTAFLVQLRQEQSTDPVISRAK